jgi:LacI family transcriptional regulator
MGTIRELGYRPRAVSRDAVPGDALTVALMVSDLVNPYLARLTDRIAWEARSRGLQLVLMTTRQDPHLEESALNALLGRRIHGVIACPTGKNIDKWASLVELGVKVIFIDRTIPALDHVDVVSADHVGDARRATEYLINLGHTRIGFLSGPLGTSAARSHLHGYETAHRDASVVVDTRLIRQARLDGDGGNDAIGSLLALPVKPTAVIVANNAQGQNAIRRLLHTGVRVPQDLSVIVFDDSPWTELTAPPLTVLRPALDAIATHACDLVVGRIEDRLSPPGRAMELPSDLLHRSSCAPPATTDDLP